MRGGFSIDLDHEENSVMMVGWSRREGEQEIRHNIDSHGAITDITDVDILDTLTESLANMPC